MESSLLFAHPSAVVWSAVLLVVGCAQSGPHRVGSATVDPAGVADRNHNLLRTYDFENGIMLPWMASFTPPAHGSAELKKGAMCLTVEQPGKDRWDAQLRHRQMVVQQGHVYQFGFKVWASRATRVTVKVGMSGEPCNGEGSEID